MALVDMAHVALVTVILVELFCLTATTVLVLPKYNQIMRDLWSTPDAGPDWNAFTAHTGAVLKAIGSLVDAGLWIAIGLAIVWIVFEWRVRSENKSFMRLSALGTIATFLGVLSVMMFAAMILPTVMAVPNMRQELPERIVAYNTQRLNPAIASLESAMAAGLASDERSDHDRGQCHQRAVTSSAPPRLRLSRHLKVPRSTHCGPICIPPPRRSTRPSSR